MLRDKHILLGVTGGIAAYKSVQLLRDLQKAGAEVRVILTPNATRFVGVETFQALTNGYTALNMFQDDSSDPNAWVKHVHWAEWADLFLVAPCTANTLGKIAHGLSDNLLTTTIIASRCPVLISPTMDGHMYEAPATRRNISLLQDFGYHIIEPEEGYLASGMDGKGRLPARNTIISYVSDLINDQSDQPNDPQSEALLAGKKVVVTAGPTRESIDPVRFISNPSSGKMGVAMAEAAKKFGAEVTLIHGPLSVEIPSELSAVSITTAEELHRAVRNQEDVDIYILAAAVSDFAPAETYDHKVKKDQAELSIPLSATPDTLQWLGEHKKEGQTLIGFAMESENVIENARKKRSKKNADWIVANSIARQKSGFGGDENRVTVIGEACTSSFEGPKKEIAQQILKTIFSPSNEDPRN